MKLLGQSLKQKLLILNNVIISFLPEKLAELGTFGIFEIFDNKKWFVCIFYQVNNLFLHQSYLKSPLPSQINLTKNAKKSFFTENLKNTESAQLCKKVSRHA